MRTAWIKKHFWLVPCVVILLAFLFLPKLISFLEGDTALSFWPRSRRVSFGDGVVLKFGSAATDRALAVVDFHSRFQTVGLDPTGDNKGTTESLVFTVLSSQSYQEPEEILENGLRAIVTMADIDGDGVDDIWGGMESGILVLWESCTERTRSTSFTSGLSSLGLNDVDSDGHLDAWWCDPGDDHICVLWGPNPGSCGFQSIHWRGGVRISRAAFTTEPSLGNQLSLIVCRQDEEESESVTVYPVCRLR